VFDWLTLNMSWRDSQQDPRFSEDGSYALLEDIDKNLKKQTHNKKSQRQQETVCVLCVFV